VGLVAMCKDRVRKLYETNKKSELEISAGNTIQIKQSLLIL